MANGFEIPSQSAAQGLLSGAQMGLQLGQMNRQNRLQEEQLALQKRQEKWEQGYKKAGLAIQTAALLKNNPQMQARVMNNGFLPLWNDPDFDVAGNNATTFEPFTLEDMQDKEFQDLVKKAQGYIADKELAKNPELQMQAVTGLFMDFHAKRGNTTEAQKLALDLAKGDTDKTKQIAGDEDTLRKEFNNLTKDFQDTARNFRKIDDSSALGTAAGDMAMIFAYMKMLDPGSTVREGEYATAEQARGVPAGIIASYNKVLDGQKLTPDQRQQFVGAAESIYTGQEAQFAQLEQDYSAKATGRGGSPNQVLVDHRYRRPKKDAGPRSFKTLADAESANLPPGTEIMIGGRRAVVE